ncbi:hypothetical protein KEM56_001120 [Ascosphaera pollenicola]|nr:hypothetical protein KEM56_001120 [Ascosphaera pollenicola]
MSSRPFGRTIGGNRASTEITSTNVPSQMGCYVLLDFPLLDKAPQLRSSKDWPRWYLHVCVATRCVFLKWDDPLALPEPTSQDKEYRALYSAFWQKILSTVDEKYLLESKQYETLSAQVNFLKYLCEDESKRDEISLA